MMKPMYKQLLGFLAISVGLRILTFFRSVIDHDESTYIVIGDAILQGARYWIDVTDVKPVGIFWLYAGFLGVLGHSIAAMRLMAAVFLGLTAFLLSKTKLAMGSTPNAAFGAGVVFLVLNSIYTYYGISPNTETFFTFFTMLAFWIALRSTKVFAWMLAGLAFGLGFIIKYVVMFDAIALGLFLLASPSPVLGRRIKGLTAMVVGAALPFACVFACYAYWGATDKFIFHTFQVSKNYPVDASLWEHIKSFADLNLRFFPFAFLYYLTFAYPKTLPPVRRLGLLWSLAAITPVLLPGKFFGHYYIQFFLPFSFVAGEFFSRSSAEIPRFLRPFFRRKIAIPLLLTVVVLNFYFQKKDYIDRQDTPKKITSALQPKLKEGDLVYAGNYHHILYFLLDRPSPSPYIHRSLLWTEEHRRALNIQLDNEIRHIFDADPAFIVVQDTIPNPLFNAYLEKKYTIDMQIKAENGRAVFLYARKNL